MSYDIADALDAIDPAQLSYEEWLAVGQALHHEGFTPETWRDWSRRDSARFKESDFEKRWRGFSDVTDPVTGGTIVKMARDAGWTPKADVTVYDWDSVIGTDKPIADGAIAAGNVLEALDEKMGPCEQARAYIDALFGSDEVVGYVNDAEYDEKRGKWKPAGRGVCHRTAGELSRALAKGDWDSALGSYEHDAGVWVCINPLDGEGRNNTNVTSLRYTLVESDETDPAVCKSIFEQLNLPIAAMVYSGSESLHAIIRVDAEDQREYNERRDAIYKACEDNGLAVDRANKNAARLSRMPGANRGEKTQFLVSLSCGAGDFEEWQEWYAAANDDLPDVENLADKLGDKLPALAREVIEGILRERHKLLISGPSKAGKSFILIALCICLAEGLRWLGFKCRQCKVLYVNLELDAASCWHRFADVYAALGCGTGFSENIDVWNLRGMAEPMNKLLPKMVRRGREAGYEVIVIDPIYKIMTGDENSASDMTVFANAFDRLALEVGCSVVYCHHHSKGWQDGKRSIDRASGSGVFGRDPDAILDLIELEPDEKAVAQRRNAAVADWIERFMADEGLAQAWHESADEQTRRLSGLARPKAVELLEGSRPALVEDFIAGYDERDRRTFTAWRCEGTLREFASFAPVSMWFDYPLHVRDDSLSDAPEKGSEAASKSSRQTGEGRKVKSRHEQINDAIAEAVEACGDDGVQPTRSEVLKRMPKVKGKAVSIEQVRKWTTDTKSPWSEWICDTSDSESGKPGTVSRKGQKSNDEW